MNYVIFGLLVIGSLSFQGYILGSASVQIESQESSASEITREKGVAALRELLDIHRSGISYHYSDTLPVAKSYMGWVKDNRKRQDSKPFNLIHHSAIDLFSKSSFLADSCVPVVFPVSEGTQLVQDLEIIAGKPGSQSCLAAALPLTRSAVGRVSAALLLAVPQSDVSILIKRQNAIRALMNHFDTCEYLYDLYGEFAQKERYCLPVLAANGDSPSNQFDPGALILNLPLIRRLKKHPLIRTFNDWVGIYSNVFWLSLLGFGVYKLSAYAYQAFRAPDDGSVQGGKLLTPEQMASVEFRNDYMPPDVRFMWRMSDSNKWRGSLALLSAGFCAYWGYHSVQSLVGSFFHKKLQWYLLTQAACGFRNMRAVYNEVKSFDEIRALPDCALLYEFFENKLLRDQELFELCNLFDSVPLDASVGSSVFSGYVGRAYDLLDKKSSDLADLTVCFARLEVYIGLADLMKKEALSEKKKYSFVTYASESEGAVFDARGLWNPFISPDCAVSSTVTLGGIHEVRNYLITGLNAGGKSTFLKSVGLGAVMGQTLGIAPAEACHMSIFAVIETYLNITDDLQQGNSLFKKEVMRAADLLKRAEDAAGKPVLLIFDEMFSGTTPYEGVSCAYSVARHIAQKRSILSCIATHFMYLTQLAQLYRSVENKCVRLELSPPNEEGKRLWMRTYTLHSGISDQHVALDMLEEQGVANSIISNAHEVLQHIEENGLDHKKATLK
jgi:hypothetical protein